MKYKPIGRSTHWTALAFAAIWAGAAAVAVADQITLNNLTLPNVRITGLTGGELEYISAGARRNASLDEVTAIEFRRYPGYAEAMGRIESDPAAAAETFSDLAADVREDYLRPLMKLRAAQALDNAGRFQDALELYLEAVEGDDSDYFVSRVPSNVPTGERADAARAAVNRAISRTRDGDVKAALQGVLERIAQPVEDVPGGVTTVTPPADAGPAPRRPEAPEPASDLAPTPPPATPPAVSLRTLENLIASERYDGALEQIERLLADDPAERMLAELYYQRGRAEAGLGRHFSAALSLLRVPVHFPEHELAAPAMELAGHELKAAGETDAARKVWTRAMEKIDDAAMKRRLMQAIDSL